MQLRVCLSGESLHQGPTFESPIPAATSIDDVNVASGQAVFQAHGRVIDSGRNAGSGVTFQSVEPRS